MPIILSVDDACASDVRVAELAKKYGIHVVFYWPVEWHSLAYAKGYEPLAFDQAQGIADEFEVGSHTITHRHLTDLSEDEAKYEIEESRHMLESMFDTKITKFAPPRGYSNGLLTKFTEKFYERQRLTKGNGLVHIHPDSGANDNKPWRECINMDTTEAWCHSWELDKYNLWDELEDFLEQNRERY